MKNATDLTEEISNRALRGAKKADKVINKSPYKAISVAAGIGALVGFVFGRRCSQNNE